MKNKILATTILVSFFSLSFFANAEETKQNTDSKEQHQMSEEKMMDSDKMMTESEGMKDKSEMKKGCGMMKDHMKDKDKSAEV